MSFVFKVNQASEKLDVFYERRTPSPVFFAKNGCRVLIGEVYEDTKENEVLDSEWEKNPEVLRRYRLAASLISCQEEKCFFMSDITATENIYYCIKEKTLYLSDDFWDIVRAISPAFEDIDIENTKLRLFMGGGVLLNEGTIVKGIKYLNPGMMAVYDRINGSLEKRRIMQITFKRNKKTYDDIIDGLDEALNRNMREIKKKFSEDTVFGIGLSGGLDSRTVLHYARKNNMKCVCFNLCMERPNGIFRARSVRMAKKIAKIYQVPFYVVEWDVRELDRILEEKRKLYPNGCLLEQATDIFKINYKDMPRFDVLLSGGGGAGMQFFSSHYPDVSFDSDEELAEFILKDNILCFQHDICRKINKILNFLKGKDNKERIVHFRYDWQRKLYQEQAPVVLKRIKDFLDQMHEAGVKDSTELLFDFRAIMFGSAGRYGAFESRFGLERSFFLYDPYVMVEGEEWDAKLLKNRKVLKELICRKIPEISMIGEETYSPAPGKKGNALQMKMAKLAAVIDRMITGDGSHIAKKYWKTKEIKEAFQKDWDNDCVWFKKLLQLGGGII